MWAEWSGCADQDEPNWLREQSKRDSSTAQRGSFAGANEKKRPRCSGRNDRSGWVAGVLLGIEMGRFGGLGDVSKSRSLTTFVEIRANGIRDDNYCYTR